MRGVDTEEFTHYLDPDECKLDDTHYKYTICRRILPPHRYVFHEGRPATCLWCVAGHYFTTDVGF